MIGEDIFLCGIEELIKSSDVILTEGHFERHLNRMRNIFYKEKAMILLIAELKKKFKIKIYDMGQGHISL